MMFSCDTANDARWLQLKKGQNPSNTILVHGVRQYWPAEEMIDTVIDIKQHN